MTSPTDWRAQRYAAKSPAWRAGYAAYSPMAPGPGAFVDAPQSADWLAGWLSADDDYATKSAAWQSGYRMFTPGAVHPSWRPNSPQDEQYLRGWEWAEFDYDEARDRAREDRQHYPASPLSAFERNRP